VTVRRTRRSGPGSLVVVGTGIRLVGQITFETFECLKRAPKLFYLVNDPAAAAWIRGLNPSAETLEDCYVPGIARARIYKVMADRILAAVRSGLDVCAAFYGHPGVFVDASHEALRRARREGFPARMLPGISAEDCLIADLGIDPGDAGCQSFEATDFLLRRRRFDRSSSLILWQVGVLGEASVRDDVSCRRERLAFLTKVLRRSYPARHRVIVYEAALYPVCDPVIRRVPLNKLEREALLPWTTLYVPPMPDRPDDPAVLRWFDEA
jgi:uncharacterized protein YabN with tetrapyrrole methylase and pyrophosphatase domain